MSQVSITTYKTVECVHCQETVEIQVPADAEMCQISMAAHVAFLNLDKDRICKYHRELASDVAQQGDAFDWSDFVQKFPFRNGEMTRQRSKAKHFRWHRVGLTLMVVMLMVSLLVWCMQFW